MDVVFGILGRTALRIAGMVDEGWGPPRERGMLAALLINAGRRLPIDLLVDWVWPEETPPLRNPIATFHTYATRIRKSLQRADASAELSARDGTYVLEVDSATIDYIRFRTLMTGVHDLRRQGQSHQALSTARQALALWRGRPLEDLQTDRARAWRHRVLTDEFLPANTTLLETLLELGDHATALARADDLLADYPHDLGLVKVRLAALLGLRRYNHATAYYFNARRRLRNESDLQAAEHLKQFHDTLMETGQPAPAAGSTPRAEIAVPRQLPHDLTDFVGRTGLLRALDAATTKPSGEPRSAVVILDGTPGVGKTALAVHWGHLARHRFPDGDFFVNMNGFAAGAIVPPARIVDDFLIALGHPPARGLDERSRQLLLSNLLAHRHALVVLDNARNTDHVKDLIALLPSCVIIVTSRQRLTTLSATTGARRVRVEPMPPPEATELLSAQLGAGRTLHPDDRARVIQLCGGLPLVITVLAEHIVGSGITQLSTFAQHLDRRQLIVDIGEDGDGSAIAHTFFSWSYHRLAPPERRLFRLLGLHPGPNIPIDVACALDGRTAAETKSSFRRLVAIHLLELPDIFDRYRFHDLLREFAAYCAEQHEPAESRHAAECRMLSFCLHSAINADRTLHHNRLVPAELPVEAEVEPVVFATAAQAKRWFDQERTNLTAAVQFAHDRGHHEHAWRLADAVATFFDRHGYYGDSHLVRRLAVLSARAAGDRDGETGCLEGLGMVHLILGEHAQAQQCLDTALRYAMDDRNHRAQATTLHHLGRLAMQRGDPATAVDLYRKCLEVAQRIDDHMGQCWTHCRVGEVLRKLDQHDQALVHLFQALSLAQRLDEPPAQASSLATIGAIYRDKGDQHAAIAYAKQALGIAEAIPDLAITVQACVTLAEITNESGDGDAAIGWARHAVELCQRSHNVSEEARSHDVLGDVQFDDGDLAEAVATWRRAADLYDRIGNPLAAASVSAKIDKVPPGDIAMPSARAESPSPELGWPGKAGDQLDPTTER